MQEGSDVGCGSGPASPDFGNADGARASWFAPGPASKVAFVFRSDLYTPVFRPRRLYVVVISR